MSETSPNHNYKYKYYYDQIIDYGCKNCGSSVIEDGYPTRLCPSCRDKLSRRSLPIWTKLFFIIIIGLIIYSFIRFPITMKGSLAYEKGKKAESQKKYVTARNQYQLANEEFDSTEIEAKIIICKFYCGDYVEANNLIYDLRGKIIEDKYLYDKLIYIKNFYEKSYNPDEVYQDLMDLIWDRSDDEQIKYLTNYITVNPYSIAAADTLSSLHYLNHNYEQAKEYTEMILDQLPDNQDALSALATYEIQLDDYDAATETCEELLDINKESISAYVNYADMELHRKNKKKALEYVEKAYSIDPTNLQVLDMLIITYQANKMYEERDSIFDKIGKMDLCPEDIEYYKDYKKDLQKEGN